MPFQATYFAKVVGVSVGLAAMPAFADDCFICEENISLDVEQRTCMEEYLPLYLTEAAETGSVFLNLDACDTESERVEIPPGRDPKIAGVASVTIPGLGEDGTVAIDAVFVILSQTQLRCLDRHLETAPQGPVTLDFATCEA